MQLVIVSDGSVGRQLALALHLMLKYALPGVSVIHLCPQDLTETRPQPTELMKLRSPEIQYAVVCVTADSADSAGLLYLTGVVSGSVPNHRILVVGHETAIYKFPLPRAVLSEFILLPSDRSAREFGNRLYEMIHRIHQDWCENERNVKRGSLAAPPAMRDLLHSGEFYSYASRVQHSANSDNLVTIDLHYATDREVFGKSGPAEFYGEDRGQLSYGTCSVSLPKSHEIGKLESASLWKLQFRPDPEKHVVLLSVDPMQADTFFTHLAKQIEESAGKGAFIFVHGYNVTFEDAARRTAQIAYDLDCHIAPIFYSWPSQGSFWRYPVDEENVNWTQAHLEAFLQDVLKRTSTDRLYLIAHSMGNRALTRALVNLHSSLSPEDRQRVREVILTAPDIDAEIFLRDIAPKIVTPQPSVTLYASATDKALVASKAFHGYPRAGDTRETPLVIPGIETIDATDVNTGFLKLNHSYYGDSRSVMGDIYYLIREGTRAARRFSLAETSCPAGTYWKFKP
jgi:esterase/lipase superfamily enzyme